WPTVVDPTQAGAAGAVFPLAAAAGFAGSSVLFKRMEAGASLVQVVAWQMLLGGVPLLAVSAWLEPEAAIAWSGAFTAELLFLGVVGSALAAWLWYWLVQRDEVGRLSLLLFAVPLLGLALAVPLFHEPLGPLEIGGVAATLGATLIVARDSVRAEARP
ncbi:MAG: EamA family transporter, partial [Gemmatimonadota bacterium]